jgi:hydrogenase/urease accessory protein HupE
MKLAAAAVVIAVLLISAGSLQAHEIGTTLVSVEFQMDRTFRIEITTDAQSLAEKLATVAGEPVPASGSSAIDLQAQIREWGDVFRGRFSAAFDGAAAPVEIDYSVSPPADHTTPPLASIKLNGAVPAGARQFTWMYSWTFATYALAVRNAGSAQQATQWLEGGQRSSPIDLAEAMAPPSRMRTAATYLALGFTHIVPHGLDHMLFVLGIFLLSRRMKQVFAQVSAFTLAHSITLALSIYGALSVSPAIVEPMIAVSIAYVAIENLFMSELKPWRIALVFGFGLLHGMGFAGALKEAGLPRSEFFTALVTFNIGVEAGQLAVIAAAFLLVGWYWGNRVWYRRRVVLPASAFIACTAIFWTVQRMVG